MKMKFITMFLPLLAALLIVIVQHYPQADAASSTFNWGYSGNLAPSYWSKNYPHCYGTHQSPVNIKLADVQYDPWLKPFTISANASTKSNYTITNLGMNVNIYFGTTEWNCDFEGYEELHYCYRILQLHFHWGSTNAQGSEHTVDGKMFPLELHFVTWNCRDFKSYQEALNGVNGLAVIGVLFEVDDNATPNPIMEKITKILELPSMRLCPCANTTDLASMEMEYFDVNDLFPTDRHKFFRYKGSLTTPPCTENALWSVLNTTMKVTPKQLDILRHLQFANNSNGQILPMVNNYRPVLPLNPDDPANALRFIASSFRETIGVGSRISVTTGFFIIVSIGMYLNIKV